MRMNKLLCLCLICCLLLCAAPQTCAVGDYSDITEDAWYFSYVSDLSQKGMICGLPDGTFRPEGVVTLGEALKLTLLAAGYPAAEQVGSHWADGYLRQALELALLPGGMEQELDRTITRLELARLAAGALGLYNTLPDTPFVDSADSAALSLYQAGIIEGIEKNGLLYFAGEQTLTRAEISAVIWRVENWRQQEGEREPAEEPQIPEVPALPETSEEPSSETPPQAIIYNEYTLPVLEGVPVFSYDPESFYLKNGVMQCSDPSVRLIHGIDVSYHQGAIDWDKVAADQVDFAIIRGAYRGYTVGSLNKDNSFDINVTGALRAGLEVGVYVFSQAITVEEALEEADFLLEMLEPYTITGPVVFDWEVIGSKDARTYGLDTQTVTAAALAFCQRIQQAGYTPMIYFNSYAGYVKYDLSQLTDYDFWFAQYRSQPDFYYNIQMWQYTSSGRVDGISGNVDRNVRLLPTE